MNRILELSLLPAVALAAFLLLLSPKSAAANPTGNFRYADLPASLHYQGSRAVGVPNGTSLHHRHERSLLRSLEAPTRYRTKSILRYSKALGDTGLVLRVKAPLKQREFLRLELRF